MTTTAESRRDPMDLSAYVRVLMRRKWLIISIVLIATLLAIVAALVMTPIYRSEVLVAAVSDEGAQVDLTAMAGGLGALAGWAGIDSNSDAAQQEALATLVSRIFTTQFIQKHALLTALFHDDWDAEAGEWVVRNPDKIPDMDDAFEKFDETIRTVAVDKRSGLITLGIEWEDRFAAANWANTLIDEVNQRLREQAIVEANTSIKYLEDELAKTSVMELRQAIFRLVENQIQLRMMANVRQEFAFKVIDPAVPAAADKEVAPKRVLMVLSAFSVSLFFAMALALVLDGLRRTQQR